MKLVSSPYYKYALCHAMIRYKTAMEVKLKRYDTSLEISHPTFDKDFAFYFNQNWKACSERFLLTL